MSARIRAARSRSTTRPAASCLPRARTRRCRAATAPGCCSSTTGSLSRRRPTISRRSPRTCATPISASRRPRTASTSSTATATTSRTDAFALFAGLGVESDGAHAFYLGAELTKAETAWRLGKRYAQDEPLSWGVAPPCAGGRPHAAARPPADAAAKRRRDTMPMIRECIVTTADGAGKVHIAPLGIIAEGRGLGHRAVPALDARSTISCAPAVCGRQLCRRRAHLRRLPDRPPRLAAGAGRGFPRATARRSARPCGARGGGRHRGPACVRVISAGWRRKPCMRRFRASTGPRLQCSSSPSWSAASTGCRAKRSRQSWPI